MQNKIGYPYPEFMEWLQENGVSFYGSKNYASQCRRMIRHAGISDICNLSYIQMIDSDKLEEFLQNQGKISSQTPFRRAWTCFRKFIKEEAKIDIPNLELERGWEDVPPSVAQAILDLNDQDIPFRVIPRMKWDIHEKLSAHLGQNVINCQGKKFSIPTAPLLTITQWAYGDKQPTRDQWILPRAPHSQFAMPVRMMRKVAGILNTA